MEPDDIFSSLCTGIDRILNSPYPVALKTLNDTLRLDADGRHFRFYAASNPCKVQRLAKEVFDAIELWPYVIGILEQLCVEPTFRAFILQDFPTLLDSLLQKAISSHSRGFHQYHEICLQLLCEPLPACIPLPTSAEKFFVCVVDQAIQSPSATTLCRVYDLLTGACQGLPQILPQNTWAQLEQGLMTIVGNAKSLRIQSVSLICLGVIHALAAPSGTLRGLTQSQAVHSELTTDMARAFFSGGKAAKSLSLAALQAVWSCKPNASLSFLELLRSLDIVLNIFLVVDAKVRSDWSKTPEGQENISRLMSKAMEEGLDLELQMRLFAILGTVVDPEKMPTEIVATADTVLLNARLRWSGLRQARDLIVLFLEGFGSQISHEAWTKLLGQMLKLATYAPRKIPAPELRNMCLLSQTIGDCLSQIPSLRKAISFAFSTLQDDFLLQRFLKEVLRPTPCGTDECCNATSLEARRALGSSISSLYLGTALTSGLELRADMAKNSLRMLVKFQQLACVKFSCDATTSIPRQPLNSFVEANCTPDAPNEAHDWKDRLSAYTRVDAKHQEKSLIRLVGDICHDLEERCATAEEPLHQEQERTKQLQQEMATLLEENSMLQDQCTETSMHVESLDRQKSEVEACLSEEQNQTEGLLSRVRSLEQKLRETKEAAEEELRQVREHGNEEEMELRASLSAQRCTIEDLEEGLKESKEWTEGLERELRMSKEANESLQMDLNSGKARVADLEGNLRSRDQCLKDNRAQLETQSLLNRQIQAEVRITENKNEQILAELSDLREKHQNFIAQSDRQRAAFEDEVEKAKLQMKSLVSSHNSAVEKLSTKAAQQEGSHNVHIRNLKAELEMANRQQDETRTRLEENSINMAEYQQRIQQLEDLIAEKEDEIQEFQAMRQTLAAAIGTNLGGRKHVRKAVHYHPEPETQHTPVSRRRSRRLTIDPKPHSNQHKQAPYVESETSLDVVLEVDRSFESASSKSGPTPKRVKQYKPFRAPTTRQPRLTSGLTRTANTQMRMPLLDVSTGRGNMSPVRPSTVRKSSQGKELGDANDVEVDFGSGIFTSKPFTPGPVAKTDNDHFYDDTTADE